LKDVIMFSNPAGIIVSDSAIWGDNNATVGGSGEKQEK
jgi:hypothetical protein